MDGQKDWQSNLSKPPGPLLSRKVASAHKEKQLAQVSDFRAASFSYVCVCVCCFVLFVSWCSWNQAPCHQHHQHHCLLSGSTCKCGLEGERRIVGGEDSTVRKIFFLAFSNEERIPYDWNVFFLEREIPLDCVVERGSRVRFWLAPAQLRWNPRRIKLGCHRCPLHSVSSTRVHTECKSYCLTE